jgi:Nif-specific regulatory protein
MESGKKTGNGARHWVEGQADLQAVVWRCFFISMWCGSVISMIEHDLQEQLNEERVTLEALWSLLIRTEGGERRIRDAVELIRQRLNVLYERGLASEAHGASQPEVMAGTKRTRSRAAVSGGMSGVQLVGQSAAMRQIEEEIYRLSQSHATVLIRGESGTGKELVARAIHILSPRGVGPFVPLHCAAVTETLLESELFGHERGAFTGAQDQRKGKFELADGGTLFLDEIGDIPPATQVKLLRVLQDKCIERVGGGRTIAIDVRLISATHRDLEAMIHAGSFREDLYYRLNVVPIMIPPLRERPSDIPLLIKHFLTKYNRQNHRVVGLGADVSALMNRYHWPGNVRELQNCLERLVVMADPGSDVVTLETIPTSLRGYFSDMRQVTGAAGVGLHPSGTVRPASRTLGASLQEIEREELLRALERAGWVQVRAARALGLTPRQVAYKMKKYGISDKAPSA